MKIDFSGLGGGKTFDTVFDPRELFSLLPRRGRAYQYLRDVQSEVLNAWFERRTDNDIVLKMNTGSGKTIVGLLILKSCANEGIGPVVYVVPDSYLRQQVVAEAGKLGIAVTDDEKNQGFLRGKSILVINIHKLINGLSVFGVGGEGTKIRIGSVVVDDVHACLSIAESQFTLTIEAPNPPYGELLSLFKDDLRQQSEMSYLEIESGDPQRNMLVPFWAWQNRLPKVTALIHKHWQDTNESRFKWPLIKDNLQLCSCVFGGGEIEISPKCLPIDVIPSFVHARRRLFMSATLSDDSVLATHFDVGQTAIANCVVPSSANDIGDRMILIPQELNPDLTSEELKAFLKEQSKAYNVVVIVPSGYRAAFWSDVADRTLTAENIYDGVADLKNGRVGLVVLVNKYDGIDLPHEACRILVIDGLPDVRRRIDKIEQVMLGDSEYGMTQVIQRIEQGMGRGIRANDDHCVVILMGNTLTKQLCSPDAIERFTPATKAQFQLSTKLAERIGHANLEELESVILYNLNRDSEWMSASRSSIVDLRYDTKGFVSEVATGRRESFNYGRIRDFASAARVIQDVINNTGERRLKGWLKMQLAEATHFLNPGESQVILASAVRDNLSVTRPMDGIQYSRLEPGKVEQAQRVADLLAQMSPPNRLIIEAHALLESLTFEPDTSEGFERAFSELASWLGFEGQRPERESGKGPDVLWALGDKRYFVIECKNGATGKEINKQDSDQLSGSMNWFKRSYDSSCSAVPILIHPQNTFIRQASPPREAKVITASSLASLRTAVRSLVKSLASMKNPGDQKDIARLLSGQSLTANQFESVYTVSHRVSK